MLQHFSNNRRRHGAYIVHFGIVLMFIGFAGSAFNRSAETELNVGQSMDVGPYHLVSGGFTQESNENYIAERAMINVSRGGKEQFQLQPEARLYQASQNVQSMVANHSTPLWDLYVIYEGQNQNTGLPIIKAFLNPLAHPESYAGPSNFLELLTPPRSQPYPDNHKDSGTMKNYQPA